LLTTARLKELDAVAVQVEKESAQNTILDSGSDAQVVIDRARNAFRATPVAGN
jgi:inulin fructotransferase (DFA-I-forming)